MTDTVKSWIEERRGIRAKADEEMTSKPDSSFPLIGGYLSVQASDGFIDKEDLDAIVDAHNNLPRALNALNKVLELHVPETEYGPDYFSGKYPCVECNRSDQEGLHPTPWPCPTVQAIEGAIK